MCSAFLNIDNRKMSRSLGDFLTVREISEKYDLQILCFFVLSAHYRSPLNFSADLMGASKSDPERTLNCVDKLKDLGAKVEDADVTNTEKNNMEGTGRLPGKFEEVMDDDSNTADTISAMFELMKLANFTADASSTEAYMLYLKEIVEGLYDALGVITEKKEEMLDNDIKGTITARQQIRKDENLALASEIRGRLLGMGIVPEDTREGVK